MTHFLITGTAGFIGFHLARRLLDEGHSVTGMLEDRAALDAAAALESPR